MQITDILRPQGICLQSAAADKAAAIHAMAALMDGCGVLSDAVGYERAVLAREAQSTTGLGNGLAVPHAKSAAVKAPGLVAMTLREGIDFAALDGRPVRLLFMIAAPQQASGLHIQLLAKLATLLMDNSFCERLLTAETPEEFLRLIAVQERAEAASKPAAKEPQQYTLLAVTACPAGIAHTYMAAEALRDKAAELKIPIKVETDGAAGDENVLSAAEIQAARCIIVAADRTVEMGRFAGKPLLRVPVTDALRDPEALLKNAMQATAPVYIPASDADDAAPESGQAQPDILDAVPPDEPEKPRPDAKTKRWSVLQEQYAHIMNGLSHMLPFVTSGGVLIALGYLFDTTNIGMIDFGSGTTLAWITRTIGETSLNMMYPVLAAFVAVSIAGTPALLPGVMGGYMALLGVTASAHDTWVSSGFLGALIAGFGAGYIIRLLGRIFEKLPKALRQIKSTLLYPIASLIFIGVLMVFVVNPPMGRFNDWLYLCLKYADRGSTLLLCAVIGGLMAVDFGGPINKAAYLFATAALTGGRMDFMSAAMLGGMVPSIGLAISCTIFRRQFNYKERQTAVSNYVLGASFVTEGALPFAIKDPLRVIPSCIIGSSLAGFMSCALGCEVPAPHGGLFLLPLITNKLGFLLSLLCGSALTAVLVGVLRMRWSPTSAQKSRESEGVK